MRLKSMILLAVASGCGLVAMFLFKQVSSSSNLEAAEEKIESSGSDRRDHSRRALGRDQLGIPGVSDFRRPSERSNPAGRVRGAGDQIAGLPGRFRDTRQTDQRQSRVVRDPERDDCDRDRSGFGHAQRRPALTRRQGRRHSPLSDADFTGLGERSSRPCSGY